MPIVRQQSFEPGGYAGDKGGNRDADDQSRAAEVSA
jgi:hypothetical protein